MKDSIETELRARLNDPKLEVSTETLSHFLVVEVTTGKGISSSFTVHRKSDDSDAKLTKIVVDLAFDYITKH